MNNFIGISRNAFDHWVFDDAFAWKTWTYILHRAQYSQESTQVKINGYWITQEYGEFIYGRTSWSERLKIPEQRLRTIIKRFEKENMIVNSQKSIPRCSVYAVVNYAKFNQRINQQINQDEALEYQSLQDDANQPVNQPVNQRTTSEQPANNQRTTTIKNIEKEKKEKKGKKDKDIQDEPAKSFYGSQCNVALTKEEIDRLRDKYPDDADDAIEFLSKYIVEKKYHSESHNLAIQRWVIDAVKEKKSRSGNSYPGKQQSMSEFDRIMNLTKRMSEEAKQNDY